MGIFKWSVLKINKVGLTDNLLTYGQSLLARNGTDFAKKNMPIKLAGSIPCYSATILVAFCALIWVIFAQDRCDKVYHGR